MLNYKQLQGAVMKTWLVKELSQLVNVSVKTLHHYDKIGLLSPKLRQENNYRLYSEKDLSRLQQIIALKFFGFDLKQIAALLAQEKPAISDFSVQATMLQEKADALHKASQMMQQLVEECEQDTSITWGKTCKMIEVFQMTQQLESTWVKQIFNQQELKQYAELEAKMFSPDNIESRKAFEKRWDVLMTDLKEGMAHDPHSAVGIALVERMMLWVNELYGKEYAHLRTKKMEQGFGEGLGLEEAGFSQSSVDWLMRAMDAYWADRIHKCLSQIKTKSKSEMLSDWEQIMDDMYGNEQERKVDVMKKVLEDERINEDAKAWIQSLLP